MGLILELSNDITVWLPFGVTLGAIALAGSLALVVLAMRARSDALLRRAASRSARADARYQKEAAIVSADPGALFVWRNIGGEPIARTGAASVLAGVLDADDKGELQDALTTLGTGGSMFSMTVPGSDGRVFQAYGKPTAGQAALWLRDVTPDAESNYNLTVRLTASEEERARLGDLLDVAPMPVWRRDENLNLVWANRAYVEAVDPAIGADVITDQIELDRDSRVISDRALQMKQAQTEKRYVVVKGQRRALEISAFPMDGGVASYAIDVTDIDETKRLLQQHIDTHEETLHRLPVAVAIFGPDQRLKFSNKAFGRLWDLDERWLATHPSDGEILERLRDARKLPEQRAFNTIYEVCVLNGAYSEALRLFGEHEEMRKSLWKPRFTPVSFSLLLTAAAEQGPELAARVRHLPRLLHEMGSHGVLPRVETCERLVRSCLEVDELEIAQQVVQLAARAGHTIDPKLAAAVAAGGWVG
jgi:PAS domain-containing protein